MRQSQRGVTLMGWLFLLIPLAIVFYAGIRLTPIYLNYMRVARSLQQLADEGKGDTATASSLRGSLEKHFEIESIEHPGFKEIDIRREGEHWVAEANYQDVAPLFADISLLVQFDKRVEF
jgi:hypothetical protein